MHLPLPGLLLLSPRDASRCLACILHTRYEGLYCWLMALATD